MQSVLPGNIVETRAWTASDAAPAQMMNMIWAGAASDEQYKATA